jgi:methenyltetrahydrofolate cyclohydrolase
MTRPENQTLQDYLTDLGAKTSTPGGGSAAAITGAQGAALLSMVCSFTRGKDDRVQAIHHQCSASIERFLMLAEQDIAAFKQVMVMYKQDLNDPRVHENYQQALHEAADVPGKMMSEAAQLADAAEYLAEQGNQNLITDVAIGANLLEATINSARANVLINFRAISDEAFKTTAGTAMHGCKDSARRLRSVSERILDAL